MVKWYEPSDLYKQLEPVIQGLGYQVAEFTHWISNNNFHANLVIHSSNGISVQDCSEVHRVIQQRIEALVPNEVYLTVSSPGLNKKIKFFQEFTVYTGEPVKIMKENDNSWQKGVIVSTENKVLSIEKPDGEIVSVPLHEIKKARLDNLQEG
ncbi:MAG: hypothetical protein ACLFR1_01090 [Spirochaetia bacterium]